MSEKPTAKLSSVYIFANGMCACFDANGQQMPELQGEWNTVRDSVIKADSEGTAEYYCQEWRGEGSRITRERALKIGAHDD